MLFRSALRKEQLSDQKAIEYMNILLPIKEDMSLQQKKNIRNLQEDLKRRYFDAPDLKDMGKNAYRFINAVSDFATHNKPLRETANYKENLFMRTLDGHSMIDQAYRIVKVA